MPNNHVSRKNLDDASLDGADLSDNDLTDASMRRSRLKGANLQHAALAGADLHGAQLDGADVTGADLRDADLTDASLHGVDLDRAATTEGVRLAGARGIGDSVLQDRDDNAPLGHLTETTADILALTQDIADVARAVLDPADASSTPGVRPDAATRHVVAQIVDLQARRNLLEDRILSLLDEQAARRPASTQRER